MNIEDHSRAELEAMLEYVETRGGDKPPVLIGGWAVHARRPDGADQRGGR